MFENDPCKARAPFDRTVFAREDRRPAPKRDHLIHFCNDELVRLVVLLSTHLSPRER
jgi:hypothetical protein